MNSYIFLGQAIPVSQFFNLRNYKMINFTFFITLSHYNLQGMERN
mgnify:CR=1 FL=1